MIRLGHFNRDKLPVMLLQPGGQHLAQLLMAGGAEGLAIGGSRHGQSGAQPVDPVGGCKSNMHGRMVLP
ncbi:hypothetical protein D3C75_1375190 [compost metagenome]